ncbi:hypothetical protein HN873_014757 [Arachis hypogaea]
MTVSGRPESSPGDHQPTDQERDLLQRSVKKVRQGFTGTSALVPWVEDWMQEETPELAMKIWTAILKRSQDLQRSKQKIVKTTLKRQSLQ